MSEMPPPIDWFVSPDPRILTMPSLDSRTLYSASNPFTLYREDKSHFPPVKTSCEGQQESPVNFTPKGGKLMLYSPRSIIPYSNFIDSQLIEENLLDFSSEEERDNSEKNDFVPASGQADYQSNAPREEGRSKVFDKGLRRIADQAYEVVKRLESTTYKDVSQEIMRTMKREMQSGGGNKSELKKTEELNIKRRVYDALNVMIAMGVLQKDGRRIIYRCSKAQNQLQENIEEQFQFYKKRAASMGLILNLKLKQLEELKERKTAFARLLLLNKNKTTQKGQCVRFPFVMACLEGEPDLKIKRDNLELRGSCKMELLGDIDAVTLLK